MAKNRKKAEKVALELLSDVERLFDPKLYTTNLYKKLFPQWTDVMFERWIERLSNREEYLTLIIPNFQDIEYDDEAVKDLLVDKLNVPIMERIWWTDSETGERFLTPESYAILKVSMRRQSQHLLKKQSIAKDTSTIDQATGQVTGASKGGRLSLPEIRLMAAKGLDNSILEAIKVRGGDSVAMEKMLQDIRETGEASVDEIMKLDSVPQVTETLRAWLFAAHYENTLPKGK